MPIIKDEKAKKYQYKKIINILNQLEYDPEYIQSLFDNPDKVSQKQNQYFGKISKIEAKLSIADTIESQPHRMKANTVAANNPDNTTEAHKKLVDRIIHNNLSNN